MSGQYPTFGNTGTYGGAVCGRSKYLDSPGPTDDGLVRFFSGTWFWELEPILTWTAARLALERPRDEEMKHRYIVRGKAGPVEIVLPLQP
jgi:hypothetical protein